MSRLGMKRRHWICLGFATLLFALFVAGETEAGQRYLYGKPLPNEDHFATDDRAMGSALAPFVYCLLPAGVLVMYVVGSLAFEALRRPGLRGKWL